MSYYPQNQASRNCCRCHLPLTDAASLNEGIGPICRKLDNALLARLIPANFIAAIEAYKSVDMLALVPETLNTFMDLEAGLLAENASGKEDWRKEVKRVEWILSFGQTEHNQKALKLMVASLGYVGIVALWNGDAATGKATCTFNPELGRLFVTGPQNKGFRVAFKKLAGWKFHPAKQMYGVGPKERPMWSVPAVSSGTFFNVVITHYPNFEGLHEAVKAAAEYVEAKAAEAEAAQKLAKVITMDPPMPPPAPKAPFASTVSLEEVGEVVKVKTPYHVCFIATLKGLPYTDRKWNAAEKVWEVALSRKAEVEKMLTQFFPAQ